MTSLAQRTLRPRVNATTLKQTPIARTLGPRVPATKAKPMVPSCRNPRPTIFPKLQIPSYCKMPLENIKYILGPCSFHQFIINGRNFYLFGEEHGNINRTKPVAGMTKDNSIMFGDFVHSLVTENPEKTYDLMFENKRILTFDSEYSKNLRTIAASNLLQDEGKRNEGKSAMLDYLEGIFVNCFTESLRDRCEYENLRVHNVDFRELDSNILINTYLETNSVKKVQELLNEFFKHPLIQKQINQIKDQQIKSSLIEFFEDRIRSLPHLDPFLFNEAIDKSGIVMDMYAMPRLLRDFNPIKKNSAFSGTAENIIYYAGDFHVSQMVVFLTLYLNLQPIPPKIDCEDKLKRSLSYRVMAHLRRRDEHYKSFLPLDVSKTLFVNGNLSEYAPEDEAMLKLMRKMDSLFSEPKSQLRKLTSPKQSSPKQSSPKRSSPKRSILENFSVV